jgi:hypothetical protein
MTTYPTPDEMLDLEGPPIEALDGERWRGVVGHEELYSISSAGRLWSNLHKRLLRPIGGRRVVLAGGRATSVGELALEAFGSPKPSFGAIAWPIDRSLRFPYSVGNLRWLSTRAELMAALSVLRQERARPRPQAEAEEYDVELAAVSA